MLTALIRNWRISAELLLLAPTKEVADNCYKPARDMVQHDEELSALLHVQDHLKMITHRTTRAELKVIAADSNTVSGKKASFVLIDELWLFGKMKNAGAMLAEATGGLVSRPEGFVIELSTHSDEPPAGVFKEKLDYFRDVRDGIIEDRKSLGVLYEFPAKMIETEAYLKPENFYVTNPNIDRSVTREWLEDKLRKVLRGEDEKENKQTFLAKHLNVEIGTRLRRDRWKGAQHWDKRANPELTLDEIIARSEVLVAGIDGGGLDDLLGLGVIGREKGTRRWLGWARAWAQPEVFEQRQSIVTQLEEFKADGDLILCEDVTQDLFEVGDIIEKIRKSGKLAREKAVGFDPAGVAALVEEIAGRQITEDQMIAVPQGFRLQPAILGMPRKLKDGSFVHCGSRLLAWCVGNAKEEKRGNATVVEKAQAGVAKIDPLIALFNAFMLMSRNPEAAPDISAFINKPVMVA